MFPLAPMSLLIIALTVLVLAVPEVFVLTSVWARNPPLLWVALLIAAGCLLVWLYARPNRFEVSPQGLAIVWPLRRRLIVAREISRVRPIDTWELRHRRSDVDGGCGLRWAALGAVWLGEPA